MRTNEIGQKQHNHAQALSSLIHGAPPREGVKHNTVVQQADHIIGMKRSWQEHGAKLIGHSS